MSNPIPESPQSVGVPPSIPRVAVEEKVDLRDVMPVQELPAPDIPPDPTLVELIAIELKADSRRATDISHLLG